jgi:PAS domain-containing protein
VVARVLRQHYLLEEKRQAEEALQQHLEWLDTTLASIDDAVLTTDPAGTITFLNPMAAHLTGWSALEACGQPIEAVLRLCQVQTRQVVEHPVHQVLNAGVARPARLWSAMCSVCSSTTSKPSSNNDTQPTYSVVALKVQG